MFNLHARTFDVNTLAHFWTLKAFLPEMIKKKSGHIVSGTVLIVNITIVDQLYRSP